MQIFNPSSPKDAFLKNKNKITNKQTQQENIIKSGG